MIRNPLIASFLATILVCATLQAGNVPKEKEKFDVFLLVGQSNMAGRGILAPDDKLPDPRVLVFDARNEWTNQGEPIHFDKPIAGVGLGFSFAKQAADHLPGVTVGLVPCAVGGSGIEEWQPGAPLFTNAVKRTLLALQSGGVLKGILWHQGESSCGSPATAASYRGDLTRVIEGFRTELHSPEIPFLAGELGEYLYSGSRCRFAREVNEQIDSLPGSVPNTAVVPSKGLTPNPDQLHFDAASLKELGKRYFEAYQRLTAKP